MSFEFDFTSDKVAQILAGNSQAGEWYFALCDNLPGAQITTVNRVAAFMAQTSHESGNYKTLHENLNYSAKGLVATWPKRFTVDKAPLYERKPEKIANCVYSNRLGNGDETSGDGWKYRGRGILQITGKENYSTCSQAVYGDNRLVLTPDLLESDPDASIKAACWFWTTRKLNQYADELDIKTMTAKINGGYIGLDDRLARFANAVEVLKG